MLLKYFLKLFILRHLYLPDIKFVPSKQQNVVLEKLFLFGLGFFQWRA